MIAMALANRPDILIADEPTTALDVTVQAQILNLIKDLKSKYGMAVILITHDLTIVKQFSDYVYVMQHGHVQEHNTTEALFANPRHAYTRHLLASEPKGRAKPIAANSRHHPRRRQGEGELHAEARRGVQAGFLPAGGGGQPVAEPQDARDAGRWWAKAARARRRSGRR